MNPIAKNSASNLVWELFPVLEFSPPFAQASLLSPNKQNRPRQFPEAPMQPDAPRENVSMGSFFDGLTLSPQGAAGNAIDVSNPLSFLDELSLDEFNQEATSGQNAVYNSHQSVAGLSLQEEQQPVVSHTRQLIAPQEISVSQGTDSLKPSISNTRQKRPGDHLEATAKKHRRNQSSFTQCVREINSQNATARIPNGKRATLRAEACAKLGSEEPAIEWVRNFLNEKGFKLKHKAIYDYAQSIRNKQARDSAEFTKFKEQRQGLVDEAYAKLGSEEPAIKWVRNFLNEKGFKLNKYAIYCFLRSIRNEQVQDSAEFTKFKEQRQGLVDEARTKLGSKEPAIEWVRNFLNEKGFNLNNLNKDDIYNFLRSIRNTQVQDSAEFTKFKEQRQELVDEAYAKLGREEPAIEWVRNFLNEKRFDLNKNDIHTFAQSIRNKQAHNRRAQMVETVPDSVTEIVEELHREQPNKIRGPLPRVIKQEVNDDAIIQKIFAHKDQPADGGSTLVTIVEPHDEHDPWFAIRQVTTQWGGDVKAQMRQAEKDHAESEVTEARKAAMRLEDELVKNLVGRINNFSSRKVEKSNQFENQERLMGINCIVLQLKRLAPKNLIQRCLDTDLHSAILHCKDKAVYQAFIQRVADAVQTSNAAAQAVGKLFNANYIKQAKELLGDDHLEPLLSAMVEKADTAHKIQEILDILKVGSQQLNPNRTAILEALKNKNRENTQQSQIPKDFDTQLVNLLDDCVQHIDKAISDPIKLRSHIESLLKLFDQRLVNLQPAMGDEQKREDRDKTLFGIAKELKRTARAIWEMSKMKRQPPSIPQNTVVQAINLVRERIRNEAFQNRLVDNQIKYLPKINFLGMSLPRKSELPDSYKMAFVACLPEAIQEKIYHHQPSWRSQVEKIKKQAPVSAPAPKSKAVNLEAEDLAEELLREMDKEEVRAVEEQGRFIQPEANLSALRQSRRPKLYGPKFQWPSVQQEVEKSEELLRRVESLRHSEQLEEITRTIEEHAKRDLIGDYGLRRFGDGTEAGVLFEILTNIVTENPNLEKRRNDYTQIRDLFTRRRDEIPADDLPLQAKRQKLDEFVKKLDNLV